MEATGSFVRFSMHYLANLYSMRTHYFCISLTSTTNALVFEAKFQKNR